MSPPESSYPTAGGPEYLNIVEIQAEDLKTNYKRMIEILKEE